MLLKKILLLLPLSFFLVLTTTAQKMNAYDKQWKKVDSLLNKGGLIESALKEVNKIYDLAKKEKNEPQQVKALTFRIALSGEKQENEQAATAAFSALDKEIAATTGNTRAILQSISASQYQQYYNNQRWRIRNRTTTVNFVKDDVNTWSADDFHKKIMEMFTASLSNEAQLQQTKLSGYDAIIRKGNVRELRPTLYDLLAHRALDYFKSDDRNITRPAYLFEINQPEAIADVNTFVNAKFQTKDDQSNQFKALQLFQRLLKFHLNDVQPNALVDADIERIEFVNTYGAMANKSDLYKQALEKLTNKYGQQPFAAQASFLLASYYAGRAATWNAQTNTENRLDYVKAVSILEQVLENKTESEGRANSYNLLKQIKEPVLGLQAEKVNVPAQNFRALVTFKNITQLNARIIKVDDSKSEDENNRWDEAYWKKLVAMPVLKTFAQKLPDTKDYQQHLTEIPVAGLPVGKYILLVSPDDFSFKKPMAAQHFYVSNLAYISSEHNHHVLNRTTGEPVARANVQIWNRYYDYKASKYQDRKGEQFVTDQYGAFAVARSKTREDNQYRIDISTKDDRLAIQDYQYNGYYRPDSDPRETKSTFLFTDRAIYRPGQIVYVKGIMVKRSPDQQSSIFTNQVTFLQLLDANGQKVSSQRVTTNAYGSYSARFTLPAGLLNGNFRIVDTFTNSQINFNVEEYKRPKFEVAIEQPTGTYRLNEKISVEGTAKAYAGNNIDGATVKYRVVRRNIYPFYDFYMPKIWPPGRTDEMEIVNGTTTTDANGKFKIDFTALPESDADKKSMIRFNYEVSADVTDINGETRSGNTSVSVGFQALILNVEAANELPADSASTIKIISTNLNGAFEKATVTLNAYPLTAPQRQFRSRYWEQPDEFVLSEQEFHNLFPNDIYKDENQPSKWTRGASVLNITDTTSADGKFAAGKLKLPAGWYAIEVTTKDKFGEEVKGTKYVLLTAATDLHPEAYFAVESNNQPLEPGQIATYTIKSNLGKAFIIRELIKKDEKSTKDFINLTQNSQSFTIPVTEADRGNIGVIMATVKNNRFYAASELFTIPYSNKELTISYETFRDKTLPGSQEKWKVKITGSKKEKVAAEMLTTMYDASLDQFVAHGWSIPSLYSSLYLNKAWDGRTNFMMVQADRKNVETEYISFSKEYDELETGVSNGYGYPELARAGGNANFAMRSRNMEAVAAAPMAAEAKKAAPKGIADEAITALDSTPNYAPVNAPAPAAQPAVRTNLNETAFFLPDLQTDADGNVEFSFTMPEALTSWKWMIMAHTKELAFGYSTKNVITQKELMVQPNAPRFLREGDRIDFSTKIVNLSNTELTGQVKLLLIDPSTNQSVDGWFNNVMPNQYFTVAAGQSTPVSFSMLIPYQYNRPLTYRVVAEGKGADKSWSDGEEALLPVVSNRMLVTESMPLPMRGNGSKDFNFTKLQQSGNSETLGHQSLTVEFTTNPAWYAVQALPYLMEYPYECAEQLFNRYYANALATNIANSTPALKATFERWKNADTSALLSNLMKNEELKSVLLQETPWVLQAQNETQQKKQIGLLFDLNRMSTQLQSGLNKLLDLQSSNGGFVWFKGGPDDRFITQYIATGIGRLRNLKALPANAEGVQGLIDRTLPYLDKKIKEDYDYLIKHKVKLTDNNLGYTQIQYLYMRSFFPEKAIPAASKTAYDYYRRQSQQHWLKQNKYMQGMIAIALNRTGDKTVSKAIMASLKESALVNEEMGMYWKENNTGGYRYYWHQAPIEQQALLIEAFKEVNNDTKAVEDAKTWLLKQKQTQDWRTTKATADAIYALLLQGNNWLASTPEVQVTLGATTIRSNEQNQEAGTGYFKEVIEGSKVKPEMGKIKVNVSNGANSAAPSWGAVYWQYFEDMDKITHAATPLNLQKKLFVEKNTDRGPVLQPVNAGDILKVGDKIKVRIELRVDRDMEYVHMKDMRASCMEPVNVLSGYRYQGGLGYYESTKDASTNFFFSYLQKGTWVFEYPMFVTHTGNFSNGITTIQCMYAPEFTSHSEGVKVVVEK